MAMPGVAYVAVTAEGLRKSSDIRRRAPRDIVKHSVALSALDLARRSLAGM